MRIREIFDPDSGIRDGKNSDPGSGINIPNVYPGFPQTILLSTVPVIVEVRYRYRTDSAPESVPYLEIPIA